MKRLWPMPSCLGSQKVFASFCEQDRDWKNWDWTKSSHVPGPPLGAAGMEFRVIGSGTELPLAASLLRCHVCGDPNHLARDCLAGSRDGHGSRNESNFQ